MTPEFLIGILLGIIIYQFIKCLVIRFFRTPDAHAPRGERD